MFVCTVVNKQDMGLFLYINITMTTVTFQFHCCVLACLCKCAPVYASLRVCCKKKKKITLTVASQRGPWALKLRRRGSIGSQKAVLFNTDVCNPLPLDFRSPFLSSAHVCINAHTHTHTRQPPAVRSPGGSEAH